MTVLDEPSWLRYGSWVACPLLGAAAAWLLKSVAGWVVSLPWAPFQGPFELVESIPEPHGTAAALVLGLLAGVAFAYLWAMDRLVVTVSPDEVVLLRGGSEQQFDRSLVGGAFIDGKRLVLLGTAGDELAREPSDLGADRLREAFTEHGYRWLPADPYADDYRLWVPDLPDLPGGADAVLAARQRALEKGSDDELRLLRRELARLGVVVRDEKKHQYWRIAS